MCFIKEVGYKITFFIKCVSIISWSPKITNSYFNFLITIITETKIFIRTGTSNLDKKHAIIEEITQSLGLAHDSYTYEDSMFYEGYTTTQQLSKMDKEVIKMLYTDSYAKR